MDGADLRPVGWTISGVGRAMTEERLSLVELTGGHCSQHARAARRGAHSLLVLIVDFLSASESARRGCGRGASVSPLCRKSRMAEEFFEATAHCFLCKKSFVFNLIHHSLASGFMSSKVVGRLTFEVFT